MQEFKAENHCIGKWNNLDEKWEQQGFMMCMESLNQELIRLRHLNPSEAYCILGISHEEDY